MLHVGTIFHVVIGARSLFNGSPLMQATKRNCSGKIDMKHYQILKRLLELGADVNVHDVAGYTPLQHCLTIYGNDTTFAMAKLLLANGADPNRKDRFGCTPLIECVKG